MKTLYLRIYLTVVVVLLLFAFTSGWMIHRNFKEERLRGGDVWAEQLGGWAELAQNNLPSADQPEAEQRVALLDLAARLRLPLALDNVDGQRIATSENFAGREASGRLARVIMLPLSDGRKLWVLRAGVTRRGGQMGVRPLLHAQRDGSPIFMRNGAALAITLVLLFFAVAAGAFPVVRRLTRRLESLQRGVEAFGAGALHERVDERGGDEVAAVATSFNRAASRIEALVHSHQSLLANASHELRSPLARLKMAVSVFGSAPAPQREHLLREIETNIAELDALVDEVLLASRLDASQSVAARDPVDLLALAAEEASRVLAQAHGEAVQTLGDEKLLRRALRNLLENARRYGGSDVSVRVSRSGSEARVQVCDQGPGIPVSERERIFEPFYRLHGHTEAAGGVGLGLSLVRQIARQHNGQVHCESREEGGSCFVLTLPLA